MNSTDPIIAICGLDCSECTIFQAGADPAVARRIATWFGEERGIEVAAETIRCPTCRGDLAEHWSPDCAIRPCCEGRGLAFCSDCAEFPCARLLEWSEGSERYARALARLEEMRRTR